MTSVDLAGSRNVGCLPIWLPTLVTQEMQSTACWLQGHRQESLKMFCKMIVLRRSHFSVTREFIFTPTCPYSVGAGNWSAHYAFLTLDLVTSRTKKESVWRQQRWLRERRQNSELARLHRSRPRRCCHDSDRAVLGCRQRTGRAQAKKKR